MRLKRSAFQGKCLVFMPELRENPEWQWLESQVADQVALPDDEDALLCRGETVGRLAFKVWAVILDVQHIRGEC